MKKQFLTLLLSALVACSIGQTATDFTVDDCTGVSHNLFSELDSGNVVVICWVMPCGACVSGALTTYNVVQSYASSHPGKVIMYICDDFANTACSSLNSWVSANGLTRTTRFSDASIQMTDYGIAGMPKIVVLGGTNHGVLYNINNGVDAADLQSAIDAALTTTGTGDLSGVIPTFNLFPNPASKSTEVQFNLLRDAEINIELFNLQGQRVISLFKGRRTAGENKIPIDVSAYAAGIYLVKLSEGNKSRVLNLVVSH